MSDDAALLLFVAVMTLFCAGEPDIIDGIASHLMKDKCEVSK